MPLGLPQSIQNAIEELSRLPGIGQKTAQRFAFFLLKQDEKDRQQLGTALQNMTEGLQLCEDCFHFSNGSHCEICNNPKRDEHIICTVEDSLDLISIEKSGAFRGKYHLLGGLISPLQGIGPGQLHIDELKKRIVNSEGKITEVILATNPTMEGEATATYIWRMLEPLQIKVSRIARGMPVGGDMEFTDEVTLARAIESRIHF